MFQESNSLPPWVLPGIALAFCVTGLQAQVLDESITVETRITRDAAQAQQQINQIDDETQRLIDDYRRTVSETNSLAIYNDQLQAIVTDQENEIASINQQLEGLEATNRDVVPLMIDMANRLQPLVEADMPFRLAERIERAQRLVDLLDDSDITTSEKYRLIVEAYQTEIEYGRTTEAYEGELDDGQRVQFLRIGRTLLFWQSTDGSETGWWNPNTRRYETLGAEYRLPVSDGLAIARNQVAPDLIRLPVPAPVPAEN
jgi:septal ring factor EnvC (AmiA/AmiB activator)